MRRLLPVTALFFLASYAGGEPALAAWVWPLEGEVITTFRNGADPYAAGQHRGIDIAGAPGAPVVAAAAGEVRFAGTAGSNGLTVSVRTDDGFDTSYLHLGSSEVRPGERVSAGRRLGVVGTSGVRSAAAPHVHFGVREAGSRHAYRDPLSLLPPAGTPAPEAPAAAPAPEPVPVAPVVAPVPAPRALPSPGRVPAGRRVTAPRRIPATRPQPVARRAPARRRVPAARRSPARRGVPATGPAPLPSPEPAAQRSTAAGPARASAEDPARAHSSSGALGTQGRDRPGLGQAPAELARPAARVAPDVADRPARVPSAPSGSAGLDLGWALACAGVLLAAAILGLGGERREVTRRRGSRLVAAIRPLLGRR